MGGTKKQAKFNFDDKSNFNKKAKEETMLGKVRKAALLAAMLGAGLGMSTAFAADIDLSGTADTDKVIGYDSANTTGTTTVGAATAGANQIQGNAYITAGAQSENRIETGNIDVIDGAELVFGADSTGNQSPNRVTYTLAPSADETGTVTLTNGNIELVSSVNGITTVNLQNIQMVDTGDADFNSINVTDDTRLNIGDMNNAVVNTLTDGNVAVAEKGVATFSNIMAFDANVYMDVEGSATFNREVAMDVDNTIVAGNSTGSVIFNELVTMNGDENGGDGNKLISDGSMMTFVKGVDMKNEDALVLSNGGAMDYSQVQGGLVLGEDGGQLVSATAAAAETNTFITNSSGVTGSRESAVVIEGSNLKLAVNSDPEAKATSYTADKNGSIDFDGKTGSFTVGDFTITKNVTDNIYTNTALNDKMNVEGNFNVQQGAVANGDANVATTVDGTSRIDGAYNMAGVNNVFNDDITVSGTGKLGVKNNGNTSATMTLAEDQTLYVRDGGALGSNGKTLNINAGAADAYNNIVFNGSKTPNTISGATVNALNSNTLVNSDLNVEAEFNTYTYKQANGYVTSTDNKGLVNVVNKDAAATISGSNSVFDMNGNFAGGLDLTNGARLVGAKNTIRGAAAGAEFDDMPSLYVDSASTIDLSDANMNVTGFKEIDMDGAILIGFGTDTPNKLILDQDTNLLADTNTSVQFTDDFIREYYEKGDEGTKESVIEGGVINDGKIGSWTTSSVFGDFTLTYNDVNKPGAYVSLYDKRDVYDQDKVQDYLGGQFAPQSITANITGSLSDVAKNMLDETKGVTSNGSLAGDMNYSIFQSIAKGLDTWSFTGADGKNYSGSIGKDTMAVMNGSTAAAPIYVSQDSVRNIQDTLNSRLDAFRAVKECVVNECFASDTALGSADILNERYLNRIWAGALGNWQNASARKGFDGWKYSSAGGIVGYDRAFGAAIVGASFAFIEGNYHDKTFGWNDSKIRQHNANIYGTYNASSGFFATVMGGYNYASNKLRYGTDQNSYDEKYHTHTWYASGKLGYDIMPCDNLSITPTVGVNYFYSRSGAHDINSGNIAESMTRLGRMKNHHVELPIEVKIAYEIPVGDKGGLTLMANGGYTYNFSDKGVRGDVFSGQGLVSLEDAASAAARATGRKLGHHAWNAGAGVKFRYDHWDIGVKYDYYGRNEYNSHQVTGVVGYSF